MTEEIRFQTGFRAAASGEPGLVLHDDGTVWLVAPDGSETQVSGGGGGSSVIQSPTDPGAVGAGSLWVNTTGIGGTSDLPLSVRDPSNTFWSPIGLAHYDNTGQLRGFITMSDDAIVMEKKDADGNVTSFVLIADDRVYISTNGFPIWLSSAALGGTTWGLSAPSGAEKFSDIQPAPDDGELTQNQRIHWYDATTGLLRYKQTDDEAVVTAGHSLGITDDGVIKLPGLPTSDPGVADQLWSNLGILTISSG